MIDLEGLQMNPDLILWLGSSIVYFGLIIASAHFLGVLTDVSTIGWLEVIFTMIAVVLSIAYIYLFFTYVDLRHSD